MILQKAMPKSKTYGVPRVGGGDPDIGLYSAVFTMCSPRRRG
ncbi:hypothetical protein HMPREF9099_02689 [Lachnospiraceae bacterium oral taxon 082 str. F0431]|nr:hypothetical protein HMPREF9099_02689 [Lachnospiraceae bacterium oral taxon 082 str. F0431]